ncbi:MAG: cysteine desulfurase NifS [Clostridia bacterium]|nr:cysteine desulfurase NifS [Clostridia bacterium]
MERVVYLDNSATTPVKKEVLDAMMPYFTENFGNASSIYKIGRMAKEALEKAREKVAAAIGAKPNEIYFTGSGSEADNWAIKGIAENYASKGKHIISTQIEHHAVLHTLEYLEKQGYSVTYLPVDSDGLISIDDLKAAIKDDTILITVMTANNEIGTIQPIAEIGEIAKEKGIIFHTDAVQAIGMIDIDVKALNIDMLSMSAHKFGGPKGVGALYVRNGIRLDNFVHGGGQERRKRAGTENVAGIVGMAKAITIATENLSEKTAKIKALRDKLIAGIEENIPYIRLNGHREKRLAGNVNFSFQFIEGEALLLMLDLNNIAASSGSACTSGSLDPSHVLLAIGLPHEIAHGSLRLSIGDINTDEDIDYVLSKLPGIVQRLREMSPLYERVSK